LLESVWDRYGFPKFEGHGIYCSGCFDPLEGEVKEGRGWRKTHVDKFWLNLQFSRRDAHFNHITVSEKNRIYPLYM
jgi:hypothetical protein